MQSWTFFFLLSLWLSKITSDPLNARLSSSTYAPRRIPSVRYRPTFSKQAGSAEIQEMWNYLWARHGVQKIVVRAIIEIDMESEENSHTSSSVKVVVLAGAMMTIGTFVSYCVWRALPPRQRQTICPFGLRGKRVRHSSPHRNDEAKPELFQSRFFRELPDCTMR